MKLYIPEIGDKLRLVQPWTFQVFDEYRNETLMEVAGIEFSEIQSSFMQSVQFTVPAGEVLKVDRIYIRKGNSDYSSLSFLWEGKKTAPRMEPRYGTSFVPGHPQYGQRVHVGDAKIPAKPVRFWAKLEDVNNIEFEFV